ncbi:hypothetical protein [Kineosporia succinea]|uniref:SdpI/YhfL family protein n=1 Tax=Kineosporia succinea TaxID=84632 RepID=A0ABT9NVQ4_9ACTN|nr:hypothetical protein [Kineosporia succinea]MDP9824501.1 hypothetical protein [Kineosporia succinea]
MTSDASTPRPVDAPTDRPGTDSLQQPVKGAPVDHPLHEEVPPAAVTGPAGTSATAETAYTETRYAEPGYRDPGYGQPAAAAPAPPMPTTRTATVSSPGRLGFGIGVLVLGVLLGVSDQQADGTSMLLRVPALIAALIMVAQGIQLVLRGLPRETEVEVVEVVDDSDPAHPHTTVRPRPWAAGMAAFRTDPGSLGLPVVVIFLAVWLGLADLRVTDAPESFSSLSMVSAFVLFALGWTLIPPRQQ